MFKKFGAMEWGIVAVVAVIALSAARPFTVVSPGHRGVVVRMGAVDPVSVPEGICLHWPFITQIRQISIQQQTQTGSGPCYSADLQQLDLQFKTLYRLPGEKVAELFQKYAGDPYLTLVEPRVQAALKEVVSLLRAEDMVKKREAVRADVLIKIRETLAGLITIEDFVIVNVDLSDELEKAIEKKQVAEQQALAMQYELQRAEKSAEIVLIEAKAEAEAVRIKGEALAKSPDVVSLEIAKRWNGVAPLSVSTGEGGANILLPLNAPQARPAPGRPSR